MWRTSAGQRHHPGPDPRSRLALLALINTIIFDQLMISSKTSTTVFCRTRTNPALPAKALQLLIQSSLRLTLLPNRQGRPRRLLGARERILAQHLLKRG